MGKRHESMSKTTRRLHRETATTVGTGLLINYPLNLLGLYICIDLVGMTNTLLIGTAITAAMTLVAYTRVYVIRKYFYKQHNRQTQ